MQNKEIVKVITELLESYIQSQKDLASDLDMINISYDPEKDKIVQKTKKVIKELS